jgi:hypothetical protein
MPNTIAIPRYKVLSLLCFSSTQSSKVDCINYRLCIHPFTNFPAISSYVVNVVHSLLTGDRGYVALILFEEDECLLGHVVQFLEVWNSSNILTCILGWDCITVCVWYLRIFVSEPYRYDLALQITTLDNLSWSNGYRKTPTHHIFPGFWITTLLHCNAPLL